MKKILLLLCCFSSVCYGQNASPPVSVADLNFSVPGLLSVGIWQSEHPEGAFEHPKFQYGFAAGDEVLLTFNTENLKGTQNLTVTDVASNAVVYSKQAFQKLENIRFNIPRKSIYAFQLNTNHLIDRSCRLLLQRIPANTTTRNFNCNVEWRTVADTTFRTEQREVIVKRSYRAETIVDATTFYVNSGSNATFKGGKSRVCVPVSLPPNAVRWYYKVAATRTEEDRAVATAGVDLFKDLTNIALKLSGAGAFASTIFSKGLEALTTPVGSSYCDVYLVDEDNVAKFERKETFIPVREGTRENIRAGAVKVRAIDPNHSFYLGLRNPDMTVGEHITIEVGAIVADDITAMRSVKIPVSVAQKKVAFFGN